MHPIDPELLTSAQVRWPDAPLASSAVLEHLARNLEGADAAFRLDLVFAALTLAGWAPALAEFDALVRAEARRALAPIDQSRAFADEVTQLVLERLLVSTPTQRARLAEYSAQGALSAWLRAVTTRLALNARRPAAREDVVSQVPDAPLAEPDPELAALRRRHHTHFKRAFEHAVTILTPRERTALRLTTLDGLTLAQVGAMYGKDASTISRWLATARATLLQKTRELLAVELALTPSDLDSVMRAADSELDLSISRVLQGATT